MKKFTEKEIAKVRRLRQLAILKYKDQFSEGGKVAGSMTMTDSEWKVLMGTHVGGDEFVDAGLLPKAVLKNALNKVAVPSHIGPQDGVQQNNFVDAKQTATNLYSSGSDSRKELYYTPF